MVVALYVDDKTELPETEWYTSKYDNKVKKTIGKQNADLQITNLNNNAQPFYVLAWERMSGFWYLPTGMIKVLKDLSNSWIVPRTSSRS